MKAAVIEALQQPLVVREVPEPAPAADGAVVRVRACGICRSDWHAWMGDFAHLGVRLTLPHVLGHEFTGVVEAVGPQVRAFQVGERVVVPFSQGEGTCEFCRTGHSNVCAHGQMPGLTYWGGYGELVAVPHADLNLVRLPAGVDFVAGAALGCRFMTAFHALVDRAELRPGEWLAVFGCGGVGLSAVQIGAALGASVVAVDIGPQQLALARSLGAAATVDAGAGDPVAAVRSLTGGGAHVALVDAVGIAATCQGALLSLRRRGRHVQAGLTGGAERGVVALPVDAIVARELTVLGTYGMPAGRFPELLRLVEGGRLRPDALVTRTVPVEAAGEVLAAMGAFQTLGVTVIDGW
jgi:D-arabinose 1-dehydrogenase-like Zn-dependent alcohol dehydrogenase